MMSRHAATLCFKVAPVLIAALVMLSALAAEDPAGNAADAPTPFELRMRAGRAAFQERRYNDALKEFAAAIQLQPNHYDARMFGGLSAYWGRQPEVALDCWNPLLETAKRNTNEEWDIERHRVMALSALGEMDAADSVVDRLYELRREKKVSAAQTAKGFVREHFYAGNQRVGVWEVFDERNEMPEQWTFPVTQILPPGKPTAKPNSTPDLEPLLRRLAIESTLLPGGGPGFQFTEYGPGYKRVYKRWTQKPAYTDVRPLVLQLLKKQLAPIDETKQDNPTEFATLPEDESKPVAPADTQTGAKPAPAAPLPAPEHATNTTPPQEPTPAPAAAPKETKELQREEELARNFTALGYDPDVSRMLTLVTLLKDVTFDVTRAARLSQSDSQLAERQIQELNAASPGAQEHASEFVELLSKAKTAQAQTVLREASRLPKREPYLDFVLLTAMNTRGKDYSETLLIEDLKHNDFMIRQTTALLIGRLGDARGLEQLFEEVKKADAPACAILNVALEELLGDIFGPPPPLGLDKTDALTKDWKAKAAKWWSNHHDKLEFSRDAKTGDVFWKAK